MKKVKGATSVPINDGDTIISRLSNNIYGSRKLICRRRYEPKKIGGIGIISMRI